MPTRPVAVWTIWPAIRGGVNRLTTLRWREIDDHGIALSTARSSGLFSCRQTNRAATVREGERVSRTTLPNGRGSIPDAKLNGPE